MVKSFHQYFLRLMGDGDAAVMRKGPYTKIEIWSICDLSTSDVSGATSSLGRRCTDGARYLIITCNRKTNGCEPGRTSVRWSASAASRGVAVLISPLFDVVCSQWSIRAVTHSCIAAEPINLDRKQRNGAIVVSLALMRAKPIPMLLC